MAIMCYRKARKHRSEERRTQRGNSTTEEKSFPLRLVKRRRNYFAPILSGIFHCPQDSLFFSESLIAIDRWSNWHFLREIFRSERVTKFHECYRWTSFLLVRILPSNSLFRLSRNVLSSSRTLNVFLISSWPLRRLQQLTFSSRGTLSRSNG